MRHNFATDGDYTKRREEAALGVVDFELFTLQGLPFATLKLRSTGQNVENPHSKYSADISISSLNKSETSKSSSRSREGRTLPSPESRRLLSSLPTPPLPPPSLRLPRPPPTSPSSRSDAPSTCTPLFSMTLRRLRSSSRACPLDSRSRRSALSLPRSKLGRL
ncbi:hypothetical protein CNBL2040 [Cryptococcus deneoformans B-3501A]|uniref:hypothetical protein n=1 Tax=Cryptococcus deneoformans (strain B-3501A) TaxID=283643 RepID=UPI000042D13C|nr:hypothetical protein CNBL2040 [Cryptococcus neoformans var. neoformans B-3501A]EAL17689.1 hypothetical protein CNBL2040 [Cryptococcus neoformans var. neoformans B-3501A]